MFTKTEEYLYEVQKKIMYKYGHGIDESLNIMYPLSWYLKTGRASVAFEKALVNVKPYVMARLLIKQYESGSHDDCVRAFRKKVMGKENMY